MNYSRPPMEWWLDLDKHYIGDLAEDGLVHVIEKSYADALAKELEILTEADSIRRECSAGEISRLNNLLYEANKLREAREKELAELNLLEKAHAKIEKLTNPVNTCEDEVTGLKREFKLLHAQYVKICVEVAEAKAEVERHKAIENGLLDEIKIMQDGIDNWGKMYREAIKWGDSQSALISKYASMLERCEETLKYVSNRCRMSQTGPEDDALVRSAKMLTEIASFKKGEK